MIGVTGATGFIGTQLMTKLGSEGIAIDLRNQNCDDIANLLKNRRCNTIIHLANPPPSNDVNEQDRIKQESSDLAEKLIQIADLIENVNFIVLSSIRVYPNGIDSFTINSEIGPIDGYGQGKVEMEKKFVNSKYNSVILRCSSVQGVGLDGSPRGLIGAFAQQSANRLLKIMGEGGAIKDCLHIDDLVNLLLCLLEIIPINENVILPVGGGSPRCVLDIAKIVMEKTESEIVHVEPAQFELSGWVDNNDLKLIVDWEPVWAIDEMIDESLDAVRGAT
ncbi:MAG: NAD-dependent epimerase/dehydratase family protein [Euryarchaeota archaeon]|jgi:nucleoside-diphosphate-sugar epimerase|nr:NAD-dependent epimerase/dehydratase family protein [Euryarchaeota archaeon]